MVEKKYLNVVAKWKNKAFFLLGGVVIYSLFFLLYCSIGVNKKKPPVCQTHLDAFNYIGQCALQKSMPEEKIVEFAQLLWDWDDCTFQSVTVFDGDGVTVLKLTPPHDPEVMPNHFVSIDLRSAKGEQIGSLKMGYHPKSCLQNLVTQGWAILAAILIIGGMIQITYTWTKRKIVLPFRDLKDIVHRVREEKEYSYRIENVSDTELGNLAENINEILDHVESQAKDLMRSKSILKEQVDQLQKEKRKLRAATQREKFLEEQLNRAERMESLGVMAGGVAHDLNNLLGPLVGYSEMLLESISPQDSNYQEIESIRQAAEKAANVVSDLLTLGRRGHYKIQPVSLKNLVEEYLLSVQYVTKKEAHPMVDVDISIPEDPLTINGSKSHLTQVVMNIVNNAFEAISSHGNLTITLNRIVFEEPRLSKMEWIPPGEYVFLFVEDNGMGISEEDLEHIFEPFYTKKKMKMSGSGLGLAVVYGVLKDLGGYLDVRSEAGKGTKFMCFFPATEQEETIELRADIQPAENKTVLIVDDLPEQRLLASKILERSGYHCVVAANADEAIQRFTEHQPDVVMLDMILEDGQDGVDVYRKINQINPDVPCILVSGFSEADRVDEGEEQGLELFLQKPYKPQDLALMVQKALNLKNT